MPLRAKVLWQELGFWTLVSPMCAFVFVPPPLLRAGFSGVPGGHKKSGSSLDRPPVGRNQSYTNKSFHFSAFLHV